MVDKTVLRRRLLASAILVGVASLGISAARADTSEFTLSAAAAASADTQEYGLLQTEMRQRGMGGDMLEQYGLKLNGYVEAGWTFNFDRPLGGFNGIGRLFDDKSDDPKIDQIALTLSREAFISADRFDTGFKLNVIYGADARFTQANGTNFYGSGYNNKQVPLDAANPHLLVITPGQEFPENQIDVFEAFFTMNLPVGNGLLLTLGKFETPWGQEHVEPTRNGLYSHSYMFGLSQPMTLTGVAGEYRIDDTWSVKGGVVVGWDQSLQDNNDMPSAFVQASYKASNELDLVATLMGGPEKPDNRSDYRWLLDITADYKLGPDWTLGAEAMVGYEPDVGTRITNTGGRQFTFDDAPWYGAAIYSSYKLDNDGMYTLLARGEYFNDASGARQLITEVYAATIGLNWVPFVHDRIGKNLMFRPEFRYDWARDRVFDNNTRQNQVTFAADVIFQF